MLSGLVLFFLMGLLVLWPKLTNFWYNWNEKIIYDFTKLNPTRVGKVMRPQAVEEISRAVKNHAGKICIGGGRFSMGGQIAYPNSLHIDMRQMDKLLHFDTARGIVLVQAGMTWRTLQKHIAPDGWAVKVMQSYNAFSIGGSVNVNVHGRYMNEGPLASTVLSLKIVLANGEIITCSRENNPEIFEALIGGMGGLGIVVEVELQLAKNCRIQRTVTDVPINNYLNYLETATKKSPTVFHNGDIILSDYKTIRITDWKKTEDPLTIEDEFRKEKYLYILERFVIRLVTTLPFGVALKQRYLDPIMLAAKPVVTRNYEASYDPRELMPTSWLFSTYVLQEYFVPAKSLHDFLEYLAIITKSKRFNACVINISIRHTRKDSDSLLSWARYEDTFCFVIYYKQGTSLKDQERVRLWTRQLVDAVLQVGGTYYLPYQLHPTKEQFLTAYPKVLEFAQIKQNLDPENKFTNKFWSKYLPAATKPNPTPNRRTA